MLRSIWSGFRCSGGLNNVKSLTGPIAVRNVQVNGVEFKWSRSYSSEEKDALPSSQVFRHKEHNMYVCWHPEKAFPYEMTQPIDLNAPLTHSKMKIQALTPVRESFRRKHYKTKIRELVHLTYSTKHRFFGRFGKSKREVLKDIDPNKQKRNREYL